MDGYTNSNNTPYVKLAYNTVVFEGGHGILQEGTRIDLSGAKTNILVKNPKASTYLRLWRPSYQWFARPSLQNLQTP
jgi:hypothetical protein